LRNNKGSVIIVALWALFILGILALAINSYVRPQLSVAEELKYRTKMLYAAKAGLKMAIAEVLQDETDSYDALNDAWSNNEADFKNVAVGDASFSIRYETSACCYGGEDAQNIRYGLIDEERKININTASSAVLVNFFEIAGGIDSQRAAQIADSILDWRDTDDEPRPNGAESGYYTFLKPPYLPKNGNFQVLEELLLVRGMTPEIFDSVKGRITLYGKGAININTADILILRSIGISAPLAEKIVNFRKGIDGIEATKDDEIFENISTIADTLKSKVGLTDEESAQLNGILGSGSIAVKSDNFTGYCAAEVHGARKPTIVTFVFDRNKTVKYWREN